jgi:hypothetical protein
MENQVNWTNSQNISKKQNFEHSAAMSATQNQFDHGFTEIINLAAFGIYK